MNGSKSPDPADTEVGLAVAEQEQVDAGHHSPGQNGAATKTTSPLPAAADSGRDPQISPITKNGRTQGEATVRNNGHEEGDSEAETLIDSPVKRKEAEKQNVGKSERQRMPKHRIGGLPVPTDGDEDESAQPSPVPSTVLSVEKAPLVKEVKDEELMDIDGQERGMSEALSSPRSPASNARSRASSPSRAVSELPEFSRNGGHSPNPRKRKHRASSVNLPNKRPSIEPPKRRLRGLHSEELGGRTELSLSPKLRNHRRATSTQSALVDNIPENSNRKRRSVTHGVAKDLKGARPVWEESDASSETTSHGQAEHRRPQRGVGRSTSTPGRPAGREHKRHVNKYGFTKLAEACEAGELNQVKEWRDRDPDQLELAEFAGNKPLQIAALNGNVEVVDYLIDQGCQIDCANVDKDTPLIDAAENGHLDVVHSLLRAGVDPLRQNLKGQQALDVVTDETDDADDIRAALRNAIETWNTNGSRQRREEEEEMRHRAGPTKELHFMARSYENLLKLVQINDRNGVKEFLDARVPVDNLIIAAAAKTGDSYLVNMLLAEMSEKKAMQRPERPMLSVLGTSHLEMVKSLAELDNFNPLYRNRSGKSWPDIAEERHGPNWREEKQLLQHLYDQRAGSKERRSSSPITKRDGGMRRVIRRTPANDEDEDDDSDEDEAPRRKNGRRLMSKRDMRVASGRAPSDESSDESSSDVTTGEDCGEESTMKPPESPAKRTIGQARRKSDSIHNIDSSPRLRRRSSSLREPHDQTLPTLDENAEDKDSALRSSRGPDSDDPDAPDRKRKQDQEAEAQAQAQAAAAAAKRAEEQKAREIEEEQRRMEELHRESEARAAEEQRLAEEERLRVEQEMAVVKLKAHELVANSLPIAIAHVLNPRSAFRFEDETALDFLVQHFTPIQVLKHEHQDPYAMLPAGADAPYWITNIQAAPLVGPRGVELMLPHTASGYKGSLADSWNTKDVPANDYELIGSVLASLPQHLPDQMVLDKHLHSRLSFEEDMRRVVDRVKAVAEMKARLREGEAVLRYVRLDELWSSLHPKLQSVPVEVRFDYMPLAQRSVSRKDSGNFVTKLSASVDARPRSKLFLNGRSIDSEPRAPRGRTQVSVSAAS
ncbi:Putative ankyrin repeat-containing domain superfamily [Septoria linicola]|uniref:Ankyrin repeat-containing domain superfamily n=1 Tax=Septoria linicola TaxID=215465 RepID=A0A9Q9EFA9_9PEZI|nr:putative ankyrin repeat-containing domain superfamily [Septoria linicola]USW47759.1 Putative ankyrin repeat-containing domain superfamily [Septoria linicola]